ncbi:hypothetical protein [Pedobacter metabolipauper]|uniref:Uncharacterized protein n=1 Tax=Pedobacter metabolipauper TaxID=425513 RepID=A0A4R6T2E0_9SPHI|nr:hypothetical protein [Pedobacter metabolipauper]TDQ11710.1 hypothetical protein ATK78_0835 [Pedobacter metabolipauper]
MIVSTEVEVKTRKVVEDPKLSLKQFARYYDSTLNGKETILRGSKYPGNYIPKYYEIARTIIVDTFASNFGDYDLYFDEFKRHSDRLKKESLPFDTKTDNYKNRHFSAMALEKFATLKRVIIPVLERYVLNSNLKNRRQSIFIREVKIGAMSDILLYDEIGNQIGLLKFNFTQSKLKEHEAQLSLYVLHTFFSQIKQLNLKPRHCIFVDVYNAKIFNAERASGIEDIANSSCMEIKSKWPSVIKP